MPTVIAVDPSIPAQLVEASVSGAALVGVALDQSPRDIVAAIDAYARSVRESGTAVGDDDLVALGALLGGQFVREFGWAWWELEYDADYSAFAVLNGELSFGNEPLNWGFHTLRDGAEITFLLGFSLVAAGELPVGAPGDPVVVN